MKLTRSGTEDLIGVREQHEGLSKSTCTREVRTTSRERSEYIELLKRTADLPTTAKLVGGRPRRPVETIEWPNQLHIVTSTGQ